MLMEYIYICSFKNKGEIIFTYLYFVNAAISSQACTLYNDRLLDMYVYAVLEKRLMQHWINYWIWFIANLKWKWCVSRLQCTMHTQRYLWCCIARESYITCQLSMQNMCGIDVLLIIIILRSMKCCSFLRIYEYINMFLSENCLFFMQWLADCNC